MSKTMLKDQRIMNVVLSTVIGRQSLNNYVAHDGEWLDGKRADVLFVPVQAASESLPPVLVEIQNVVDKPFLHRLTAYCNHVYEKFHTEPVAVTICIKSIRAEIRNKFIDCPEARYLKRLPCDFWANNHFIMTPETITAYLDDRSRNGASSSDDVDTSSSNHAPEPLPPMAALAYVLIEQKCSIFGLQYKEDPTVMLMYKVASEALDHNIQDHQSTVDTLMNVATETQNQFKRILDAANDDTPNLKRIRSFASAGVLYTETCLHKYRVQDCEESDLMPAPLPLPPNVKPSESSTHVGVLRGASPPARFDDIAYAASFKADYLKTHKQMNWRACYEKGLSEGYFEKYKSYRSLKCTFYNQLKE
ncbi:hypothetical protein BJV82DRAFT_589995 [Fennellomyces sp. T-0311]|nr:hypothetical protein BJV82DRAFT_589995 [Fennellomyces sp. T-0311]